MIIINKRVHFLYKYDIIYLVIRKEAALMNGTIPERFRPLFWDTQFDKLDVQKNKAYIIVRLYNEGDIDEVAWLHETYTDEDFVEVIKTARGFIPIAANYLKCKYHLNNNEMAYYRNNESMNYVFEG